MGRDTGTLRDVELALQLYEASVTDSLGIAEPCLSDADVVNKVLRGDRDVFRVLVKRYEQSVFTVCLRILGNRQDAEDCAQTAFVKAYMALKTFRTRYPFKSWLYKIAMNVCIDVLRRSRECAAVPLNSEESHAELPDDRPTPRETASLSELRTTVETALRSLEDQYRVPLALFYLEGLECTEIATVLSLRVGTVKTRLRRGRFLLREIIVGGCPELAERRLHTR
jgi:RNA polymerase sigma-70 factor (ECF subfamily)